VPALLFPSHYEQYLLSLRLRQLGSGLWLPQTAGAAEIASALDTLLFEPGVQAAARAFAKRYSGYSPAEQRRRIVARIEELLAAPRA
jgi:UDP:flavonoid glycosyltransferase YjiC (YdhE family)